LSGKAENNQQIPEPLVTVSNSGCFNCWCSKVGTAEEFLAATQTSEFLDSAVGLVGYPLHPSLYRVVRT
jgi:hypothetical protein